jgi:FtsH-binding integral membrane protein
MPGTKSISALFYLAAIYDGFLGIAFLFFPQTLLERFNVPPPHPGYIQFPAALLVVFALMFLAVARNPRRNRILIPYGILLKLAYSGVVLRYWLVEQIPFIWKPFAIADLVFAGLFFWAYFSSREKNAAPIS